MSKEIEVRGKKDLPEYEENPSVAIVRSGAKVGHRTITNKTGDKCMIVSEHGEVLQPAGFYDIVEVDRTAFVKWYVKGVKLFHDLSASGAKVFEILYRAIQASPNSDTFHLHPKKSRLSRATFDRGVVELLNHEIIYKSTTPFIYFLNITYMFNGDRLRFVKEYRLKPTAEPPEPVQEVLPL